MSNRLIRIDLFINVTLPDIFERVKVIDSDLNEKIVKVRTFRSELFETFSLRGINTLHSFFKEELYRLSNMNIEISRIERVSSGITQLREYMRRPSISPLDVDIVKPQESKEVRESDPCLEMFHFERRLNVLSDVRKMNTYEVEIGAYLTSAKRHAADISELVRGGIDLLEDRRSVLDNQRSTALGILLPACGAIVLTALNLLRSMLFYKPQSIQTKILQGIIYRDI